MPYFPEDMPIPVIEPLTEAYWSAAREHRLVIQHCTVCGTYRHLPHALCGNCQSPDHDWVESSGRGSVYTYIIVGHWVHDATNDTVPYNVAIVELDDCGNVLVPSNVVDCAPDEIAVGMPVVVEWEHITEEITIPRFRRVASTARRMPPHRRRGERPRRLRGRSSSRGWGDFSPAVSRPAVRDTR